MRDMRRIVENFMFYFWISPLRITYYGTTANRLYICMPEMMNETWRLNLEFTIPVVAK